MAEHCKLSNDMGMFWSSCIVFAPTKNSSRSSNKREPNSLHLTRTGWYIIASGISAFMKHKLFLSSWERGNCAITLSYSPLSPAVLWVKCICLTSWKALTHWLGALSGLEGMWAGPPMSSPAMWKQAPCRS